MQVFVLWLPQLRSRELLTGVGNQGIEGINGIIVPLYHQNIFVKTILLLQDLSFRWDCSCSINMSSQSFRSKFPF